MTKMKPGVRAVVLINTFLFVFVVRAAVLVNAVWFVSAGISELPNAASAVAASLPEISFSAASEPEDLSSAETAVDLVLAAAEEKIPATLPIPEENYPETSIVRLCLNSQKSAGEQSAIRGYLDEKARLEKERQEALERERKMYEYDPAAVRNAVSLEYSSNYPNGYRISEEEYHMLCYVLYHEAGASGIQEQIMVCEAIFNRVFSKSFPNDIVGVLTQKNQFSGYRGYTTKGADFEAPQKVRTTIAYVLSGNAPDLVQGAVFFCNPNIAAHMDWFNTLQMTVEVPQYRFYK